MEEEDEEVEEEGLEVEDEVHFETVNLYWDFCEDIRYQEEPIECENDTNW